MFLVIYICFVSLFKFLYKFFIYFFGSIKLSGHKIIVLSYSQKIPSNWPAHIQHKYQGTTDTLSSIMLNIV